jgi:hypothetical protein
LLVVGAACAMWAYGALVAFEHSDYLASFAHAVSAAAAPTGVVVMAIDGWMKQRRTKLDGVGGMGRPGWFSSGQRWWG